MATKESDDLVSRARRLLSIVTAVCLLLLGLAVYLYSSHAAESVKPPPLWARIGEKIGAFIAGSIAISFIYRTLLQPFDVKTLRDTLDALIAARLEGVNPAVALMKRIYTGRRPMTDLLAAIQATKREYILVGIAANTFVSHFRQVPSPQFKDIIFERLRQGLVMKFFLLDPDAEIVVNYGVDSKEPEVVENIRKSLHELQQLIEEAKTKKLRGRIEVYVYTAIPQALMMFFDREDDSATVYASPYLYGVRRADCPAFLLEKYTAGKRRNELFERFNRSFEEIAKVARRWEDTNIAHETRENSRSSVVARSQASRQVEESR